CASYYFRSVYYDYFDSW
nr:immunoglobulin heavy chain junction region [Macaca mulatta]MOV39042.1 immunoglobulin heavy chain junction region [Macaca mulatta]MOV41376.1 immunoglobulin heavy chain junction region [Macaca mulatta]MOV42506.1 immunoglobulin heavy chain junction region [Macaca mulatta]MOV42814.1 immunoglobulin heavy chain junction region [Macaca mulatta]